MGLKWNGTEYWYVKNLQGDIIGILDSDGTKVVNYVYDAWGQVSLGGTPWNWVALGELNPFRYRGYYYDTESGLYYLNSRYYDPEIGRYINADGYISTGQGIISNNMFSYCGNNPIMRADPSGRFWEELWQAFSQAINQTKEIFALAGVVSQADSPAPGPADVAAGIIAVGTLIYCGAVAVSQAIAATSSPSVSLPKEEEKDITIPKNPSKDQAYFTINPYEFNPRGLIREVYVRPGTGKNGGIIKWEIPGTHTAVFEWNEDYKNGPHYHVMLIEWDNNHDGTHYLPGTPVPEPWNTMYFGG